ncbi:CpaE-like family protein, partial [Angustibacter peucedani]
MDVPTPTGSTGSVAELLTADPRLADAVARVAAAAGVEVVVRTDPADVTRSGGPLLVGVDLAPRAAQRPHHLARRGRPVVVVGLDDVEGAGPWRQAAALGAEGVAVLPGAHDWLVHRLASTVERVGGARVLGVVGGCGGAGASLLAVAMALGAARTDQQVLLVDLDPLGGGLDLTAGLDDVAGLRWP